VLVISVAKPLDVAVVGEPASSQKHPVEWWYTNALLEAPGTPLDGLALVGVFSLFKGVIEEGRHLLISPHAGTFADFGTGPPATGTIRSSTTVLDVRNGPSRLHGAYPDDHQPAEPGSRLRRPGLNTREGLHRDVQTLLLLAPARASVPPRTARPAPDHSPTFPWSVCRHSPDPSGLR
jgi:hypothetical protein